MPGTGQASKQLLGAFRAFTSPPINPSDAPGAPLAPLQIDCYSPLGRSHMLLRLARHNCMYITGVRWSVLGSFPWVSRLSFCQALTVAEVSERGYGSPRGPASVGPTANGLCVGLSTPGDGVPEVVPPSRLQAELFPSTRSPIHPGNAPTAAACSCSVQFRGRLCRNQGPGAQNRCPCAAGTASFQTQRDGDTGQ